MADDPVVLINLFEVPPDDAEHFVRLWERARDFLETQPGYVDTALHHSIEPEATVTFVNVAHWASASAFRDATRSTTFREISAPLAAYNPRPGLYRVVRS